MSRMSILDVELRKALKDIKDMHICNMDDMKCIQMTLIEVFSLDVDADTVKEYVKRMEEEDAE